MKVLLILCVVLAGVWLWRSNRRDVPQHNKQQAKGKPGPLEIVSCTLCSVHVPSVDAIQGQRGVYCSAEHLQRAEH